MPALEQPLPEPSADLPGDHARAEGSRGDKEALKDVRHELKTAARFAAEALRSDDIDRFLTTTCFDEWINMFAVRYAAHDMKADGGGSKFFEQAVTALMEDRGGILTKAFTSYRDTLHDQVPEMDQKGAMNGTTAYVMAADRKGADHTAVLTPALIQRFLKLVGEQWQKRSVDLRLKYEHVVRSSVDKTAASLDALLSAQETVEPS